jgi:gliding motility-associated-like protein
LAIKKYISLIALLTVISVFSIGQSSVDLGTVCAESSELYGVGGNSGSTFTWFVEDSVGIIDGNGEDTVIIQWGYTTGKDFLVEVHEVTTGGCEGFTTAYVDIQAPQVDLGADFVERCDGDSALFDATGGYDEPYTMQWQDGTFSPTYTADTTELIWVLVTDGLGCTRYDTVNYVSYPLPSVNLGNDTLLCDEQNPFEMDAGNFPFYNWTTSNGGYSNGNPFYMYPVKGVLDTVTVTVTDNNGCTMSDSVLILPCNIASLFKDIPNTITPNGDKSNDEWKIPYIDQFPNAVLEVFDRWGRLVYHTEHIVDEPWDGTSKGREMPMDAYYFVLDLKYMNIETISGTINLIR